MSGINDSNTTDSYDQSQIVIMGGTDNTKIGNVGDRLKVDALSVVTFPTGQVLAWSKKLRYVDMNASNGGVARDTLISTTFTSIFSYTGSGYFVGFNLCLEDKTNWYIRLIVDGEDIFIGSTGIFTGDLTGKNIYGWETGDAFDGPNIGWDANDETILYQSPIGYPIRFDTSITLQVKHQSASKKFRAGLLCLSKET
jgi:hypothetical protein